VSSLKIDEYHDTFCCPP